MTIKNKDGSVYKINGPNKLAEKQINWNLKNLVFHNFKWQEICFQEPPKIINKIKIKDPEPEFVGEITFIKEKEINQAEEEIVDETQLKNEEELKQVESIFKYKVLMHCLPAYTETILDEFYGDKKIVVKYKNKFIFSSIVTKNDDLIFEFWTTDPNQQISEKSIVFPFSYEVYNKETKSYDKVPFERHRWWKVIEKSKKYKGWLFRAIPSDTQPDFSD